METSLTEVFPLLYVERTWIVNHTSEIVNPAANSSKNEPDINSHPRDDLPQSYERTSSHHHRARA